MIDFACKEFRLEEVVKCSLGLTKGDCKVFTELRKSEEWLTAEELARKVRVNLTTSQRAVKKLAEQGVAMKRQENRDGGGYQFYYKAVPKEELTRIILGTVNKWTHRLEEELKLW